MFRQRFKRRLVVLGGNGDALWLYPCGVGGRVRLSKPVIITIYSISTLQMQILVDLFRFQCSFSPPGQSDAAQEAQGVGEVGLDDVRIDFLGLNLRL